MSDFPHFVLMFASMKRDSFDLLYRPQTPAFSINSNGIGFAKAAGGHLVQNQMSDVDVFASNINIISLLFMMVHEQNIRVQRLRSVLLLKSHDSSSGRGRYISDYGSSSESRSVVSATRSTSWTFRQGAGYVNYKQRTITGLVQRPQVTQRKPSIRYLPSGTRIARTRGHTRATINSQVVVREMTVSHQGRINPLSALLVASQVDLRHDPARYITMSQSLSKDASQQSARSVLETVGKYVGTEEIGGNSQEVSEDNFARLKSPRTSVLVTPNRANDENRVEIHTKARLVLAETLDEWIR
ncbi:hypothetical protein V8D89_007714 [Ganoderma adspersum]